MHLCPITSKQTLCPRCSATIGYIYLWNSECTFIVFIDANISNMQNLNYKKRIIISFTVANSIIPNFHQQLQIHQFPLHHHLCSHYFIVTIFIRQYFIVTIFSSYFFIVNIFIGDKFIVTCTE